MYSGQPFAILLCLKLFTKPKELVCPSVITLTYHCQVVLHMRNKNDLVVCLKSPQGEDRVGELAAVLATVKGSACTIQCAV